MTKTIKLDVSEKLADYLESLYYEVSARQSLLDFLVSKDRIDTVSFAKYHDQFLECYTKYQMAMDELSRTIVIPNTGGKNSTWEMDFENKQVIVKVEG